MACLELENRDNFLIWNKVSGSYTLSELESSGLPAFCDVLGGQNENDLIMETYEHRFLAGYTYSFYANLTTLETSSTFNYWRVDILHGDSFTQAALDVCTLSKDIISGTDYRFYCTDFEVPSLPAGCYRIAVIDTSNNDAVLYLSNEIKIVTSATGLLAFKYRNAKNIMNYNYTGLPTFYNIFHIELTRRKPLNPKATSGYDLASGSFFRVRTVRGKSYEYVTGWFDEPEHAAVDAMLIHSDLNVEYNGSYVAMNFPDDAEYEIPWSDDFQVIQGAFRLEITEQAANNEAI